MNLAFVPLTASTKPLDKPASVETTPAGDTTRSRWFDVSATINDHASGPPAADPLSTSAYGALKVAAVPAPSWLPGTPAFPASVVRTHGAAGDAEGALLALGGGVADALGVPLGVGSGAADGVGEADAQKDGVVEADGVGHATRAR